MKEIDKKEILLDLCIEGTYFYENEDDQDKYFIAYSMFIEPSYQEGNDDEENDFINEFVFEIRWELINEIEKLCKEKLLFTSIAKSNSEMYRITGFPEIELSVFENGMGTLVSDIKWDEAIEFIKNMKTINFSDLKSFRGFDENEFKVVHSVDDK